MDENQAPLPQEEIPKNDGVRETLFTWLQALVSTLTVLILCFTFVVRVMGVDGKSMVPTLQHRDMMVVHSLGYSPKQGDVVVLTQPSFQETPLVKRVIALGGQTVDIDYAAGTVTVDGVVLDEPYLGEKMVAPTWLNDTHIEVPEGQICVFGDNRNHSTDSRSPLVGTVDEREVIGHALMVVFPFTDFGVIH